MAGVSATHFWAEAERERKSRGRKISFIAVVSPLPRLLSSKERGDIAPLLLTAGPSLRRRGRDGPPRG